MPLSKSDSVAVIFNAKMETLGSFEACPHLAVAVSGGGDSMALVLLADKWARERGGQVTALTVDHGLREESAAETEQVGRWLQVRGIAHHILPWKGTKPKSGVQQAAREARYALMSNWCRDQGVLHLLLAHNLEDQAETYLMRLRRGSGVDGLAAMSACIEKTSIRLLRPLLDVRRENLRDVLLGSGQAWVDDPSNLNSAYSRTKIRALLIPLAQSGVTPEKLSQAAAFCGATRVSLEKKTVQLLAACATIFPSGYVLLTTRVLLEAEREIARRVISRIVTSVGGRQFSPSVAKLDRLYDALTDVLKFKGLTLSGCNILRIGQRILISREVRAKVSPVDIQFGKTINWDHRFKITFSEGEKDSSSSPRLGFLGGRGWQSVLQDAPELANRFEPLAVKISLPTVFDTCGIYQIPHLDYLRARTPSGTKPASFIKKIQFCPPNTASNQGFFLA
jgi:tRNA(Ile)-lysidine synthase